jgi:hypothetical protein
MSSKMARNNVAKQGRRGERRRGKSRTNVFLLMFYKARADLPQAERIEASRLDRASVRIWTSPEFQKIQGTEREPQPARPAGPMILAQVFESEPGTVAKVYQVTPEGPAVVALRLGPPHYIRRALELAFAGRFTDVVDGGSVRDKSTFSRELWWAP